MRETTALRLEQATGAGRQWIGRLAAEQLERGAPGGQPLGQRDRGAVQEDGVRAGRVELRPQSAQIGPERLDLAGQHPDLPGHGQVEPLVVGKVLLLAAVQHVPQADGVRLERRPEDRAERVETGGHQRRTPQCFDLVGNALPAVQTPAGVVAVGAPVVDHGLAGRRLGGRTGEGDALVAGAQPDLGGRADVDAPVDLDILAAVGVHHHEAHRGGAGRERHPGEPPERVLPGEGRLRTWGDVTPGVE